MRIAIVNNFWYLRGGAERVAIEDAQTLSAAGQRVLPFSVRHASNLPAPYDSYYPETPDYYQLGMAACVKCAAQLVYSAATGRAFARFLDATGPDILHCHNIYGRLTTSILDEAKLRGIPAVMTVHDLKLVCPAYLTMSGGRPCDRCVDGRFLRCTLRACHKQSVAASLVYTIESHFNRLLDKYGWISRLLCPSRFYASMLERAGFARERIVFQPNSVDTNCYEPAYAPGDYIVYVGRLSAEKGIATLLQAMARVRLPLRIVGTGPIEQELKATASHLGLNHVSFEGYRTGAELAGLYRNAAFTVLPSEWFENAPMSALEAFAYGKPVLGADIGGIPELVRDGVTGRLFPSGDPGKLAVVAEEMWRDRELLKHLGRQARRMVEDEYSNACRLDRLTGTYEEVLGTGAAHRVPAGSAPVQALTL